MPLFLMRLNVYAKSRYLHISEVILRVKELNLFHPLIVFGISKSADTDRKSGIEMFLTTDHPSILGSY